MPRLRWSLLLIAILTASLLLAACGGDDDGGSTPTATATETTTETATATATTAPADGSGTTVDVDLVDFDVKPDATTVPAGNVTFDVKNDGSLQHEFVIVRTDLPADGLPVESALVPLDPPSFDGTVVGEIKQFDAGGEESLSVTLEPGNYVLLCNVAGHYQLGMHAAFTVE